MIDDIDFKYLYNASNLELITLRDCELPWFPSKDINQFTYDPDSKKWVKCEMHKDNAIPREIQVAQAIDFRLDDNYDNKVIKRVLSKGICTFINHLYDNAEDVNILSEKNNMTILYRDGGIFQDFASQHTKRRYCYYAYATLYLGIM